MKSVGSTVLSGLVLAFAVGEAIATGTLEFSLMKQKRADTEPLRRRDAVEDDLIGDFNGQDGVAYYLNGKRIRMPPLEHVLTTTSLRRNTRPAPNCPA